MGFEVLSIRVKFIPEYIILFDAIVNGIVSLLLFWIVHCQCLEI